MRASNKHTMFNELIEIAYMMGRDYGAAREVSNLEANGVRATLFVTGSNPVMFYSRRFKYTGEGIITRIYRDPVYSATGTAETTDRNSNDINPVDPESKIYGSATFTDSNYGTETIPFEPFYGADSPLYGGAESLETLPMPILILPNKAITLYFISRDTTGVQDYVFSSLRWCELTNIPDLEIVDGAFVKYRGVVL